MRNRFFVATSLANDPHTEGMHNAGKIAALDNVGSFILPPSLDYTAFYDAIVKYQPQFIGLSMFMMNWSLKEFLFLTSWRTRLSAMTIIRMNRL